MMRGENLLVKCVSNVDISVEKGKLKIYLRLFDVAVGEKLNNYSD